MTRSTCPGQPALMMLFHITLRKDIEICLHLKLVEVISFSVLHFSTDKTHEEENILEFCYNFE